MLCSFIHFASSIILISIHIPIGFERWEGESRRSRALTMSLLDQNWGAAGGNADDEVQEDHPQGRPVTDFFSLGLVQQRRSLLFRRF